MAKYRMDDGTVVDTDRASSSWGENTYWNGSNHISCATDSQWAHQKLYRSRKGRYYLEHRSQVQGTREHVEWVSRENAVRWLIVNEHDLPEDLADLEEEIVE